jgi:TatD DNase family protein
VLYIDSHCHLDRLNLALYNNNLDDVINMAKQAKVNKMLCVSVTLADFPSMVEKTSSYQDVYLSCGENPLNQYD